MHKAMSFDLKVTYTSIKVQTAWNSSTPIKVRRDQSSSGANSVLVLSPLEKQGELSIDNGSSWIQFFPDRAVLVVQDSPLKRRNQIDIETRFELLKRNYHLKLEKAEIVAGRKTQVVSVEPAKSKSLFARKFWIDTEKFVVLRVLWQDENKKSKIVSDTVQISFPNKLPPETFEMRIGASPKEIQVQAPIRQSGLNSLSRKVGFRVAHPSRMPMGFFLTSADAITANNRALAALRYSDGAANVTVYQAEINREKPPWTLNRSRGDFEMDGLVIAVEGDLPTEARDAFLRAIRENNLRSENALRDSAAKLLKVTPDVIVTLRGYGFGYDEVIAAVLSSRRGTRDLSQSVSILKRGKSIEELAKLTDSNLSDIQKAIAKFWSAADKE